MSIGKRDEHKTLDIGQANGHGHERVDIVQGQERVDIEHRHEQERVDIRARARAGEGGHRARARAGESGHRTEARVQMGDIEHGHEHESGHQTWTESGHPREGLESEGFWTLDELHSVCDGLDVYIAQRRMFLVCWLVGEPSSSSFTQHAFDAWILCISLFFSLPFLPSIFPLSTPYRFTSDAAYEPQIPVFSSRVITPSFLFFFCCM